MTSHLVERPTVVAVPCVKYMVRWSWMAPQWFEEDRSVDLVQANHSKTYLTKNAAYMHAAWGYIVNARAARGCDKNKCKFGTREYINQEGDEKDDRCKYCKGETVYRIAKRLARWLMWRDKKRATTNDLPLSAEERRVVGVR